MDECQQLWSFVQQVARQGLHEPHFILFQLFVDNAFEFSAINEDYSVLMSRAIRQNQSRPVQFSEEILAPAESFANLLSESEMFSPYGPDQLAMLQRKYNETKQLLQPQFQTQLIPAADQIIDWRQKLIEVAHVGPSPLPEAPPLPTSPTSTKRKLKKKPGEDQ